MSDGPKNLFVIRRAKNGQFYFYLRGGNGEIVATSEMYTSKWAAKQGVDAVKRAAATAGTIDLTGSDPVD